MKQRLGIAHALLGDPSVLILDEPANGLDPAGIRWMRGLLKGYADRGGTVLLSSHLLNEVELIADEMILIGHGRIVAQGDKKSLLADGHQRQHALVDLSRRQQAGRRSWSSAGSSAVPADHGLARCRRPGRRGPRRRRALIVLTELRSGAAGLEDLFLELTSDSQRDEPHAEGAHGMSTATLDARHDRHRRRSPQVPFEPPGAGSSSARRSTPAPASGFAISIIALCLVVVMIFALVAPDGDKDYIDFLGIAGAGSGRSCRC